MALKRKVKHAAKSTPKSAYGIGRGQTTIEELFKRKTVPSGEVNPPVPSLLLQKTRRVPERSPRPPGRAKKLKKCAFGSSVSPKCRSRLFEKKTESKNPFAIKKTPKVIEKREKNISFGDSALLELYINDDSFEAPGNVSMSADEIRGMLDGVEFSPFVDGKENSFIEKVASPYKKSALAVETTSGYLRCLVRDVLVRSPCEVVLGLTAVVSGQQVDCVLRDSWSQTEVRVNDVVHVVSESYESPIVLDDSLPGFLVVQPDILVLGTSIAAATRCSRRSVLDALFKNGNHASWPTILGSLMHDVFDVGLKSGEFGVEELDVSLKEKLGKVKWKNSLYGIDMTESQVLEESQELIKNMGTFAESFFGGSGTSVQIRGMEMDSPSVSIGRVCDIEETVWSPRFGMKGKIDATVGVRINGKDYTVPLELKTGKMMSDIGSIDHRAQVTLYSLMLADWVGVVPAGLLYYLKTAHMAGVPDRLPEKQALVMKRNELARVLSTGGVDRLPDVLQNKHTCLRCPQLSNCMLLHKGIEGGSAASSGVDEQFFELTGHLTESDIDYLRKWAILIGLEVKTCVAKMRKERLWINSPEKREEGGSCFSGLKVIDITSSPDDEIFFHTFQRKTKASPSSSLHDLSISPGDFIIVSRQLGGNGELAPRLALASGSVQSICESECLISLDRALPVGPVYCIDKSESASIFSACWSNLAELFNIEKTRLRKLVVSTEKPAFEKRLTTTDENGSLEVLNCGQRKAVQTALAAKDYALIRGMPGTGKTTAIAHLVHRLVRQKKRVLIASYTHSAVDNILLKLQKAGIDFLRLGKVHSIHPSVRKNAISEAAKGISSVADLSAFYESKLVFGTTCLSLNHPVFRLLEFDYCIIDEASQITEPVCLGPLLLARTFILVGDHYQLPPLVQSKEARDGGMGVSLFKRLCDSHPDAVCNLEAQYRMNSNVMLLANVVYDNCLKCASADVAGDKIHLPRWDQWLAVHNGWICDAICPQKSVIFLATDQIRGEEVRTSHGIKNEVEAAVVKSLVTAFENAGADLSDIGVISPYRFQLRTLRRALEGAASVDVDTVDKFQGRDKSCILMSFVRSNADRNIGDLLRDWRRINVALTRAKHKLVLIGSRTTLRSSSVLGPLIDVLESRNWVIVLPSNWMEF